MVEPRTIPVEGLTAGGGSGLEDVKHPSPATSPKQPSAVHTCSLPSQETSTGTTASSSASSASATTIIPTAATSSTYPSAATTAVLGASASSTRRTPKRQPSDASLSSSSTSSSTVSGRVMPTMLREGTTPTQRISRAKKGKRVHACNHPGCEKIFTRAEHLRRHQLNHSTEVFYKCDMCERTFVRQDLLTRHTERHATQARKAVQTLALAQRHRQFSSHFGINAIAVLAPPPPPDYGGNAHVFDANARLGSHGRDANILGSHQQQQQHQQQRQQQNSSPPGSIVVSSMAGYAPSYSAPVSIPITQPPDVTPDFSTSEATAPSSSGLRGSHLPFHLQHNEPQRQSEQYLMAGIPHAEALRRPSVLNIEQHQHQQQQQQQQQQQHLYNDAGAQRSWDNYDWLFDAGYPDQVVMEMNQNQVAYLHPLEIQYYANMGDAPGVKGGSGGTPPFYHPLDEPVLSHVLLLVGDTPNLHPGNVGMAAMQRYLRLYWTDFHPLFPLLHRATFVPSVQMVMLVAIVLAIGSSFADPEASHFSMAVYDKVRGWILNSEEFSSHNPSVLTQQLILLTDVFGKMRSTRSHLEGSQLDFILLNNLRRSQSLNTDPLQGVRRCHRSGQDYDYEAEWQSWIELEAKKRVALLFFYWDAQQATLFGRDMCQTVFDVRIQLPCDEYLWCANSPSEWIERIDNVQDGQGFLDTLKIFLDSRRDPPTLSPFSLVLVLHGLIAVGLDLQRRASPVSPDADDSATKQTRVSRGLETWRTGFEALMPQVLVQSWYQKVLLMFHMAHIALHTNRQVLLAAAGDRRFFRRNSNDFYRAKHELQRWVALPSAQLATWHAVQILLRFLGSVQVYQQDLYVIWSTYLAALICWAYGQSEGPDQQQQQQQQDEPVRWDLEQDMRLYLQQMNTDTWENLALVRRQYRTRTKGLLAVMGDTMKMTRWGLVQEGLEILKRLRDQKSIGV